MLLSYRSVHHLISAHLVHKSVEGIISDCIGSYDEAREVAHKIQDYEFLQALEVDREANDRKYDLWWDFKNEVPTCVLKDKDFTITALAMLAHGLKRSIHIQHFKDLIESQALNQDLLHEPFITYFMQEYDGLTNLYRLEFEKIRRNELCPCGSGDKYKECHGK